MVDADRFEQHLVLDTAERLFVEQGLLAMSDRQIGTQIGAMLDHEGLAVAGYHFGTNTDLVRAITRRFTAEVERSRVSMLAALGEPAGVHDVLACMVLPWIDHFAARGPRSHFARLCAQAAAHPSLRTVIFEEASGSPSLQQTRDMLARYRPLMPQIAADERGEIIGRAIVHACAEREGAVASGSPTLRSTWREAARGLIDGLAGIWTAPFTSGRPASAAPRRRTQ